MRQDKYKFKKEGIDLFIAEMVMIKYPSNIELVIM